MLVGAPQRLPEKVQKKKVKFVIKSLYLSPNICHRISLSSRSLAEIFHSPPYKIKRIFDWAPRLWCRECHARASKDGPKRVVYFTLREKKKNSLFYSSRQVCVMSFSIIFFFSGRSKGIFFPAVYPAVSPSQELNSKWRFLGKKKILINFFSRI